MTPHERAPEHWLLRFSPSEWLKAALSELERAERALEAHDQARGVAGLKRAAGMALNAALIVVPDQTWGRTYVEHLAALAEQTSAPEAVRSAARLVHDAGAGPLVTLGSPGRTLELVEAARTVMAHAYAVVHGSVGRGQA